MTDYVPAGGSPASLTFTAAAAITGGQLVVLTAADTVGPAPANSVAYVGVAGGDASAGERLTVLCGSGVLHETPAAAALAPGTAVATAAAGTVGGGANPIGISVRPGDPAAIPPLPCRWLAYR